MSLSSITRSPVGDLPGEAEPFCLAEVGQARVFVDDARRVEHDRVAGACTEFEQKLV